MSASLNDKKVKLTYFDMGGRALPIRYALTLGGVPFEDDRVKLQDWMQLKPTTPYGELPVLHVDGTVLPQSMAMLRLIGKETGLYPEDNLQAAQVDSVLQACYDSLFEFGQTFGPHLTDEQRKAIRTRLSAGVLLKAMEGVERVYQANADSPWIVGDKMTIADLEAYRQWSMMTYFDMDHVSKDAYGHLKGLAELAKKIEAIPEIAKWNKEHEKNFPPEKK